MQDATKETPSISQGADTSIRWLIIAIEYAIVLSLLTVAGVVLVRAVVSFFSNWGSFPESVVAAIDSILVVIILLDIAHTVFGNLRSFVFPVRPFLVIGILAGVRDILSESAHLTLSSSLTQTDFKDTLVSLGVGVGVVLILLLGLLILRFSGHRDEAERY
ncbi:MAG TPA: phosphate-starvation-inducible PsiE family protein [Acidimicrobiales bacterium]|nr:phosphate-starvation-inducible PsiE family protein [Acidimicrobiales bacterium]